MAIPQQIIIEVFKKFLLVWGVLFFSTKCFCQKQKADSLSALLIVEKKDSTRVTLMWQLAKIISVYNPDSALQIAQKALILAKNIKYIEGQSRSLGILANTYSKMGNYPRSLESNLQKLQLEEKRNNPRNLASVLMNIGIVYLFQEEYRHALFYYQKSDSVINQYNLEDLKYYIALNTGDAFKRLNIADSAFIYFNKSLQIAKKINEGDFIGTSMTGLGHIYMKQENYPLALSNYQTAIKYLTAADDDEILCEATLGLANLYKKINYTDSAFYYARFSQALAYKDGFLSYQKEAAEFLTSLYQQTKNIDSAFSYLNYVKRLDDSINSRARIKELQIISSNEQLRQQEIAEYKKIALKERKQQLQMLFIGIFIPGFFLFTLLLSRIRIHVRAIKLSGILSLLILFEYLTLLLHPYVLEFTAHTPVYEMLIFVTLAAILIPTHHRVERWLIEKLVRRNAGLTHKKISLRTVKIKIKKQAGN